jgi:hypothetical protein
MDNTFKGQCHKILFFMFYLGACNYRNFVISMILLQICEEISTVPFGPSKKNSELHDVVDTGGKTTYEDYWFFSIK